MNTPRNIKIVKLRRYIQNCFFPCKVFCIFKMKTLVKIKEDDWFFKLLLVDADCFFIFIWWHLNLSRSRLNRIYVLRIIFFNVQTNYIYGLVILFYCSTVSAISFFFAHSGHMISSASVINPFPTIDALHDEQTKQLLCQCRPSKEINRVPPIPRLSWSC